MSSGSFPTIRVHIFQPVIAHYQVPFFERLVAQPGLEIRVSASSRAPGAPPSDESVGSWAHIGKPCISAFGGQFVWQSGVHIHPTIGPGDVVVIDGNPRYLSNFRLIREARKKRAGVMWWGHGWSPTSVRWRAAIRYRLMALADVVTVYTDREVTSIRDEALVARPIFGINNTIDTAAIDSAAAVWSKKRLAEFRKENHIENIKLLLFCGRLRATPSTGLDLLLRTLRSLPSASGRVCLAVVGSGECENNLKALSRELGIDARVIWLGAIYDEGQLAPWFLSADLFVYPGAIGLSLLQAFAYGLPVVTNSNMETHGPEIAALEDGVNGRLFVSGDSASLKDAIVETLENGRLRQNMSVNARKTMDTEYSLASMVKRFTDAIKETASIAGRRAR
jgi:glycosyltransferase involved in cell wall biosynthesis